MIHIEDYCLKKWEVQFHTRNFNGSPPSDDSKGHDWSISYDGFSVFYEGMDELTAGEARDLVGMLNKCAIYPIKMERIRTDKDKETK